MGEQSGGDDKNKNGEESEEAGEENIYSSISAPLASPASSSATAEAWEGEARDEDIEMEIVEESCFSGNAESVAPDLGEVLPPPASKEDVKNGNANLILAPVVAPNPSAPVQLDKNTDTSVKILPKHTPLKVKDPTSLFAPGPSTSTLSNQTEGEKEACCDSVLADGMERISAPGKAFSVKECRVQLPRMTLQQEGVNCHAKMKESVDWERQFSKRKQKSKAVKMENLPKVFKTEVLLTGEECIGCGEIFTNMRRHQKLPHDVFCPNDCCERSFTSEEQLRKHMAEKHLVFARGGACEVCGEQFPDDMELAIHISQCGELEKNL